MKYAIGLDVGITSVGWAIIALNDEGDPIGIIFMGSRIFDAAENPKTGASLAAPRREARSARRRLRRHRHRNERIRNLLVVKGIVTEAELAALFDGKLEDIYALRVRALDEAVSSADFARILIHLSQRRGFRSNRKGVSTKEDGQLLTAVSENRKRMVENGYRTVGEMLLKDSAYQDAKRNKGGKYISTVGRDMIEDEVRQIFAAQRGFGQLFASEETEKAYLEILLSQRSFDEGPGGNSPYGGSQAEKHWGKCALEPDTPRAAKATYAFEYFNLLTQINHIRICEQGCSVPLTADQRRVLVELAHKTEALDYKKIRKALNLRDTQTFNMVRYRSDLSKEEAEAKKKFCYLRAYHEMRKAFNKVSKGYFEQLTVPQRNAIGQTLTLYKTEKNIRNSLQDAGLTELQIATALTVGSFTKAGHLSICACSRLIPYLEQGMNYSDACEAAGYHFQGHSDCERDRLLHLKDEDLDSITSPVVRRAISQTVKVINAIIRDQGRSPAYINIELAREMAKDFKERRQIEKDMEANRVRNERLMERIRTEYKHTEPTGLDLVKLRLFEEQGGVCAYSLRQMSVERLFEPGYAEVDHIVPYSISFDDRKENKVLVFAKENRDKGNRLPLQYLTGQRREDFIVWVNSCVHSYPKRQNLLKEQITEEDERKFKERNLQDTKTASRFLLNYIQDHLLFDPDLHRKKRVTAVNGAVTSYLRKRWGISKIRANGDLHHAVDALVVACTTDGLIQRVSRYTTWQERKYLTPDEADECYGSRRQLFPEPWPEFRAELEARLSSDPKRAVANGHFPLYLDGSVQARPLFVSRMPKRKISGAAHRETVKSLVMREMGYAVVKQPLTKLVLKDGEIENYYMPKSDRLLYEALRERLHAFNGDGKKAFAEPFHKPKSDGTPGPVVNKVKICEPTTLNVSVQGDTGMADHDSMVRIDVFHVDGEGYYLIPIYVADTLKSALPNKACVEGKRYDEWKEMRDEDFLFSLYPNDLIRVTRRKPMKLTVREESSTLLPFYETKSELLYYKACNISKGSISGITHDGSYCIDSLRLKNVENLEKYTVDVLGEYHKVEREHRMPFHRKRG